jgi:hypothetical protein
MSSMVTTTTKYNIIFSIVVKQYVEEIKNMAREKRGRSSNDKVDEEVMPWVSDMGFSRSRDTKYLKLVGMY